MAESGLSVSYPELRRAVALYLGWDIDPANWSANQITICDDIIDSGLRSFYVPFLPRDKKHEWSFMKPTSTLIAWADTTGTMSGLPVYASPSSAVTATASIFHREMIGASLIFDTSGADYVIDGYTSGTVLSVTGDASGEASGDTLTISSTGNSRLPDEFGSLHGRLTFGGDDTPYFAVKVTDEGRIRHFRQTSSSLTERPEHCAIRPVASNGAAGQRQEIMFWPEPDQDYTLSYRYKVFAGDLSASNPYPLGGMAHAETIRASCLASAETHLNDDVGIHNQRFQERLLASVEHDISISPKTLGYNGDWSEADAYEGTNTGSPTYNSVEYD